jgi:hypothetical protein
VALREAHSEFEGQLDVPGVALQLEAAAAAKWLRVCKKERSMSAIMELEAPIAIHCISNGKGRTDEIWKISEPAV